MVAGNMADYGCVCRRPPSLRLRLSSWSRRLLLLLRLRPSLTLGSDTKARSSSDSRRSSLSPLSLRSRRSLRTPRSFSRSSSRVLLILRVRVANYCQSMALLTISPRDRCLQGPIDNYTPPLESRSLDSTVFLCTPSVS